MNKSVYDKRAEEFIRQYESLRSEDVHKDIMEYLPKEPGVVLDVGSGSGRDAVWLAGLGYDVVAVEPSDSLRNYAENNHRNPRVQWVKDELPDLPVLHRKNLSYDFILVSAVWMHIPENQRDHAFQRLTKLLNQRGRVAISLRLGPVDKDRNMHPVSVAEIDALAVKNGLSKLKEAYTADRLARKEVSWVVVVFGLAT